MDKYKAKGLMLFRLGLDGIETQEFDRDYYDKKYRMLYRDDEMCNEIINQKYEWEFTKDIYDLIDGQEFLEFVQTGSFIDYDGYIKDVFVDGYKSNLGLATDNLTSGDFLVDEKVWADICEVYKVEVNWVNK